MSDQPERLTPEEEDFYAKTPTTVVNDICDDMANRIGGEYVYLADHAETDEERRRWKAKIGEVRDQRRAVDPEDRNALIAHIKRWRADLDELKGR